MGLRKVKLGSEVRLSAWLAREPFFNLYILSGLAEGLGPNLVAWEQRGAGVLMRRGTNWMLDAGPAPSDFDFLRAAAVVDSHPSDLVRALVGLPSAVEPLFSRLRRYAGHLYEQTFAVVTGDLARPAYAGKPRPGRLEDLAALTELYADADYLTRPPEVVRAMLPHVWVTEARGKIVSAADNWGRTDRAGMIAGVFTPPEHRGKGYASTVVHGLSAALLSQGRRPCLFYHNPVAGRVYKRLGFVPLGPWQMVNLVPVSSARSENPSA